MDASIHALTRSQLDRLAAMDLPAHALSRGQVVADHTHEGPAAYTACHGNVKFHCGDTEVLLGPGNPVNTILVPAGAVHGEVGLDEAVVVQIHGEGRIRDLLPELAAIAL